MTTTMLVFDIETCLDKELIASTGYPAKEEAFLPIPYHLPCAVAIGHISGEGVLTKVESLCAPWEGPQNGLFGRDDPCSLTEAFWEAVNRAPVIIGFNSRSFDIPVMELCSLRYGCAASRHWNDRQGTRNRYGDKHIDLLDRLGNYGVVTKGYKLDTLMRLLGYAGKGETDGSSVQALYEAGQLEEIRSYNRRDIISTYALWLHWARISGRLTGEMYQAAAAQSKPFLDRIRPQAADG